MGFRLLAAEDENRPEFWAAIDLPMTFAGYTVHAEAVDKNNALVFLPIVATVDPTAPLVYRGGALYVGHRSDGAPSSPETEALLLADMEYRLEDCGAFTAPSCAVESGLITLTNTVDDDPEDVQWACVVLQVLEDFRALGGIGVETLSVTITVPEGPSRCVVAIAGDDAVLTPLRAYISLRLYI